ncbi:uncharacterized protein LOC143043128 [Mytilus galloprovincialis]|uniref:uncharacterized protein LOC143043128 n=1 Tax=Mytilus galloprovincialis TaxID=29158 RepID=UPI003F7C7FA8
MLSFYVLFISFETNSASVCSQDISVDGKKIHKKYYCCNHHVSRNKICELCPIGFTSEDPKNVECEKCPDNSHGLRCAKTCSCKENERCDNVQGCVPVSVTSAKSTTSIKDETASETGSSNAVVAYMSIIATIGAVVVIGIAAWRNKEFLLRKLKKQKIRFPRLQRSTDDESGKEKSEKTTTRKSENLYDDINEKYMIKDFKVVDRK